MLISSLALLDKLYLSLTVKGIIAIIFALIVVLLVIFSAGSVGL